VISDRVRVRVRYVDTRCIRIERAPVDNLPVALNLEAGVRYYCEDLVFEGYTQQLAVFTVERRLTVVSGSVAYRDDLVIREAYEVVLRVGHHYALCALSGVTCAVERAERAGDGTLVTNCIELCVVGRCSYCIQAAVVVALSVAVQPQTWVELLASYCYVGRSRAGRLDLVFHQNLNHAIVVVTFERVNSYCAVAKNDVVHTEDNRYCVSQIAAAELNLIIVFRVVVAGILIHAAHFVGQIFRAVIVRTVVECFSIHQRKAISSKCYLSNLIAGSNRLNQIGYCYLELAA